MARRARSLHCADAGGGACCAGGGLVWATLLAAIRTFVVPRSQNVWLTRWVCLFTRALFDLRARRAATYAERDVLMALFAPIALFDAAGGLADHHPAGVLGRVSRTRCGKPGRRGRPERVVAVHPRLGARQRPAHEPGRIFRGGGWPGAPVAAHRLPADHLRQLLAPRISGHPPRSPRRVAAVRGRDVHPLSSSRTARKTDRAVAELGGQVCGGRGDPHVVGRAGVLPFTTAGSFVGDRRRGSARQRLAEDLHARPAARSAGCPVHGRQFWRYVLRG